MKVNPLRQFIKIDNMVGKITLVKNHLRCDCLEGSKK